MFVLYSSRNELRSSKTQTACDPPPLHAGRRALTASAQRVGDMARRLLRILGGGGGGVFLAVSGPQLRRLCMPYSHLCTHAVLL
jgi:hypothetical protein